MKTTTKKSVAKKSVKKISKEQRLKMRIEGLKAGIAKRLTKIKKFEAKLKDLAKQKK